MKIKYYVKPLKTVASNAFESTAWEITVAFISGVFAYVSYQGSFGLLFFPMLAVFVISLIAILSSIYFAIVEAIHDKGDSSNK